MSYDVYTEGGDAETLAVDWNITSNVAPMLQHAGLDSLRDLDGIPARVAALAVYGVAMRMAADPEPYIAREAPNQWGTYEQTLPRLPELALALSRDRLGTVRVL